MNYATHRTIDRTREPLHNHHAFFVQYVHGDKMLRKCLLRMYSTSRGWMLSEIEYARFSVLNSRWSTRFRMIVASKPSGMNCRRFAAEVRRCNSFQGLTLLAIDLSRVAAKRKKCSNVRCDKSASRAGVRAKEM